MSPDVYSSTPLNSLRPRVLVVDDEPSLVEVVRDIVGREFDCKLICAKDMAEANSILASQPIELMVTDVNLPDGDGTKLVQHLLNRQPSASAIVITGAPSVDRAIGALRAGAADFLAKPFSAEQLASRVKLALDRQAVEAKKNRRLNRLRGAVKRLSDARKVVSRKVDLLCNDLITAYGELSRQLDLVRTQENFRKCLQEAKDLEQLLCNTMDWLLRQLGYCNVAMWLVSEDNEFQLGAYMKYTIAGEQELTDAMRDGLVKRAADEAIVRLGGDELKEKLSPVEYKHLADQSILAINCTYLGESLASIVLFRNGDQPFTDEQTALLKLVSPVFAVALASIVKGSEKYESDESPFYDGADDSGPMDDRDEEKRDRKEKDRQDADWWKRGEKPPF